MGWASFPSGFISRVFREPWQRFVLRAVSKELGQAATIRNHGATQSIRIQINGHKTDVGITASGHWIRMDLNWPDIPEGADISHAPGDSYCRDSALSEGIPILATGDVAFDAAYMVLCDPGNSPTLLSILGMEVRKVLLNHRALNPQIASSECFAMEGPMTRRVHLHVEVRVGGTSAKAALDSVSRCLTLVEQLERLHP